MHGLTCGSSSRDLSGCRRRRLSPGRPCTCMPELGALALAAFTSRPGPLGMASHAGCRFADAYIKAYLLDAMDGFVACNPTVRLADCVGDIGLEAHGLAQEVKHSLLKACVDLKQVNEVELWATIAITKSLVTASSETLARRLRKKLGALGGAHDPDVVNLGADFEARVARGARRKAKAAGRWACCSEVWGLAAVAAAAAALLRRRWL